MKKPLFIFLLLLTCQVVFAQDVVNFGIKAGTNGSILSNLGSGIERNGLKYGGVAGLWLRVKIPLIGLYVQPEVVFSQTGGQVTDLNGQLKSKINLTNIDGVLLLGQRFGLGNLALRINVGPIYSQVLSAKAKSKTTVVGNITETNTSIKDQIHTSQIGMQAGIGLDISKINIDLRVQHNFTKLFDNSASLDNQNIRIELLQLTLGFKIF